MEEKSPIFPKLVTWSIFVLVVLSATLWFITVSKEPQKLLLPTDTKLVMGNPNARVQVVIFEEIACYECHYFANHIFPLVKKQYIDTNRIECVIIPLAFLQGSINAFAVGTCIKQLYPRLFEDYMMGIQKETVPELVLMSTKDLVSDFAKNYAEINSTIVLECSDSPKIHLAIEKNRHIAERLMKDNIRTPTVFVNGKRLERHDYSAISEKIEEAERER